MKDQTPRFNFQGRFKPQGSSHAAPCPSLWTLNLRASLILGIWSLILFSSVVSQVPQWSPLPPLPDREGFAAMFAGASGGSESIVKLLVPVRDSLPARSRATTSTCCTPASSPDGMKRHVPEEVAVPASPTLPLTVTVMWLFGSASPLISGV